MLCRSMTRFSNEQIASAPDIAAAAAIGCHSWTEPIGVRHFISCCRKDSIQRGANIYILVNGEKSSKAVN